MGPRAGLDGRKVSFPPGFDPRLSSLNSNTGSIIRRCCIMKQLIYKHLTYKDLHVKPREPQNHLNLFVSRKLIVHKLN